MLPADDGGTTQIDHILVSKYGIFVIETKNRKGWIFGGPQQLGHNKFMGTITPFRIRCGRIINIQKHSRL